MADRASVPRIGIGRAHDKRGAFDQPQRDRERPDDGHDRVDEVPEGTRGKDVQDSRQAFQAAIEESQAEESDGQAEYGFWGHDMWGLLGDG